MIGQNKVAAIIPARAGSQGLPGKNYKNIFGKPLIEWSILAALESSYIDDVVVTSNCSECIKIATGFDTIVIHRPDDLSSPLSSTDDTMRHAVAELIEQYDSSPDIIVLMQPTSPARKDNLVDRCIRTMVNSRNNSAITVSRHTPFLWKLRKGVGFPLHDPNNRPMRQQLEDGDFYFHDDGNISIAERKVLFSMGRVGEKPILVENHQFCSMQIDNYDDFAIMEALAERFGGFL